MKVWRKKWNCMWHFELVLFLIDWRLKSLIEKIIGLGKMKFLKIAPPFSPNENAPGGGGGWHPRAISLLSVIKLRYKDQRIAWDVPNPMLCELTYLGQPLTFQIRSNKKCSVFRDVNFVKFFVNTFFAIWDRAMNLPPSSFSRQGRSTHLLCDPERSLRT